MLNPDREGIEFEQTGRKPSGLFPTLKFRLNEFDKI